MLDLPTCKPLKTLCKIDILGRLAVRDLAWLRNCGLIFARMLSNASLRISEAFSACFLALCIARPSLQSQLENPVLMLISKLKYRNLIVAT